MRGLSLCSGIGALDLAFVLAGGTIADQVTLVLRTYLDESRELGRIFPSPL